MKFCSLSRSRHSRPGRIPSHSFSSAPVSWTASLESMNFPATTNLHQTLNQTVRPWLQALDETGFISADQASLDRILREAGMMKRLVDKAEKFATQASIFLTTENIAQLEPICTPMATSNSPTCGQSNSPMAGRSDYDESPVMAIRAAASLSR